MENIVTDLMVAASKKNITVCISRLGAVCYKVYMNRGGGKVFWWTEINDEECSSLQLAGTPLLEPFDILEHSTLK